MKVSAIYTITNVLDHKIYVGSSKDARKRMYVHRWKLRRGTHDNTMLQRAWDRDGEASFSFAVVETVSDVALLLGREQFWINKLSSASTETGYNFCPVAGTREGTKQPASVAEKLRSVHLGKPKSAEHRAKIAASHKGKPKSEQHREHIRLAAIRQFSDPAARQRSREFALQQMAEPTAKARSKKNLDAARANPVIEAKRVAAVIAANKRRKRRS